MKRLSIIFFLLFLIQPVFAQLIINEISQGPSNLVNTRAEYWELVVVGSPNCTTAGCVDIRGWIMDDNNGWHGSVGVTAGCIRFSNHPNWACVKPGSLIVIYNNVHRNDKLPPDDSTDADNDFVYVLNSNSTLLEKHQTQPAAGNSNYPVSGFSNTSSLGSDQTMVLNNSGDCLQLISPNNLNTSYHSVGWGSTNIANNIFFSGNTGEKVMYLNNYTTIGDPFVQGNWVIADISTDETPGQPNSVANARFINALRNSNNSYTPLGLTFSISPPTCDGGCNGVINVAGANGYGFYTYTWQTNPVYYTSTLNNLCAGSYKVKVRDAGGCSLDTTINLTLELMQISVSPSAPIICSGDFVTLTANGAQNYSWVPSAGITSSLGATVTASPLVSTDYTVIGISGQCTSSVVVPVIVDPKPNLQTIPTINMCKGNTTVLTVSGANQYTWLSAQGVLSIGNSSVSVSPVTSQNYTVIGSNDNCYDTAFVSVSVFDYPEVTASGPSSMCSGKKTILNAYGADAYSWLPNQNLSNAQIQNPVFTAVGNITYTVVGYNGVCADSAYLSILVNPSPQLQFSGDTVFCIGEQSVFTAAGADAYTWIPSIGLSSSTSSTVTASPMQTTIYTLIGNNAVCADTFIFKTYVSEKANLSGQNISFCKGGSGSFNVQGASVYSWSPSTYLSNSFIHNPQCTAPVTTQYTVWGNNECAGTEDTLYLIATVFDLPIPAFNVSANGGCKPVLIQFTGNNSAYSCFWKFNNLNSYSCDTGIVFNSGNFVSVYYRVTDANGCVADTLLINLIKLYDKPRADFDFSPSSPLSVTVGEVQFQNLSINADYYDWRFTETVSSNLANPAFVFPDSGIYKVMLIAKNDFCADTVYKTIVVLDEPMIFIPNSFTPNNDKTNDVFIPVFRGINILEYDLRIFDRWGHQVFYTSDCKQGWNGETVTGKILPQDVYVYKITIIDSNGGKRDLKGIVNVVK